MCFCICNKYHVLIILQLCHTSVLLSKQLNSDNKKKFKHLKNKTETEKY